MTELVSYFERSISAFDKTIQSVGDDQWSRPTPCDEWDVRALVNHIVNEDKWVPPLLAGRTIEEVGDAFDGDLLGRDPKGVWNKASEEALEAFSAEGALNRTVHVSFGDISGKDYLDQIFFDHVIHGWDLATAVGADTTIDPELAEYAYNWSKPLEQLFKDSGAFGEKIEPPEDADLQTKLLAVAGRTP